MEKGDSVIQIINFVSNSQNFKTFVADRTSGSATIDLFYCLEATTTDFNKMIIVYVGSWQKQAYRTITFLEPPTGDLLTWLQANGVKQ